MSIATGGTRKAGPYIGNGVTTSFPFSFKVFQASDLLVVQTDTTPTDYTLTFNTNYTVTLNANQDSNPGGTVNLVVAPPTGYLLTIGSQVPQLQSVTLTNNGGFYPTVINTALDYVTILIQQLSEKIGRALTLPFSTSGSVSTQLPPVSPGSMIGWNQAGTGLANVGASGVGAGSIVASNLAAGATGTALSTDTQAAATKTTPADTDKIPLLDSANFWYLKGLTWANLKAAFKTYFSTLVGTQFQVSADISPLWWGTQSTLTSGAAYVLNGNILIMEARCHNTQIDTSGNFTGVAETGVATAMFWGEDDVLRVFTAPSVTAGTAPTFGTTPTYTLDMKTGLITSAQTDTFPNFTAVVGSNALTGTLNAPVRLNFRNATLGTGTPAGVSITSNLTLTIPSGATLGTVNGVAARLVWLVAYNGGTPVLCVVNLAGGNQLDETNLISPTTISGTSNSANVIYSASAVSANSPYRVIGFTDVTEATAGTWATAPSTVQGIGGQALTALSSLGYGQTVQNLAGSRSAGTTFYNTTGKPIFVYVNGSSSTAGSVISATVNGITQAGSYAPAAAASIFIAFIVPSGGSYSVTGTATFTVGTWTELR